MMSSKTIAIAALLCCLAATAQSHSIGGLDAEKPSDEHLKGILGQVMTKLQAAYPGGFKTMEPVSYRTQVVSGMNYFVKVKVTDNAGNIQYAHLRLYRPFKAEIKVHRIKTDETDKSPLQYF